MPSDHGVFLQEPDPMLNVTTVEVGNNCGGQCNSATPLGLPVTPGCVPDVLTCIIILNPEKSSVGGPVYPLLPHLEAVVLTQAYDPANCQSPGMNELRSGWPLSPCAQICDGGATSSSLLVFKA